MMERRLTTAEIWYPRARKDRDIVTEAFSRYDAAGYLETPEDIAAYLEASAEENDPAPSPGRAT